MKTPYNKGSRCTTPSKIHSFKKLTFTNAFTASLPEAVFLPANVGAKIKYS